MHTHLVALGSCTLDETFGVVRCVVWLDLRCVGCLWSEHTHGTSLSSHTHGSDESVASGRSTVDRQDRRLERIRNVSASEPYRNALPSQLSATGTNNKTPASEWGGEAEEEEREEEIVPRDFANLMRRYARHTGTKP